MLDKNDIELITLGKTNKLLQIKKRTENILLAKHMAEQCQKSLHIINRQLEPEIFGNAEFVDAVKRLALRNSQTQIKIIVFEPEIIIKYRHRLLTLSARLGSSITMRKAHRSFSQYNGSLIIADMVGYIHRENSARYEGSANFNDLRLCNSFSKQFADMWELATTDPNLRNILL